MFKNKIKYIDVGSQFFITDTIGSIIKIKHTGKGLEQPEISHKSNLTVLTDDGFLYTFPIIYSRDIMYSSFRINDNVDVLTEYRKKVVKKVQDQLEDNLLCNKFKYTTYDHMNKPQFGGKFLMDNPDIWYGSFDEFLNWAMLFSRVIGVTKVENTKLRVATQHIPLEETYASIGIELFQEGGIGYDATPYDPFKDLPEIFKEYHKEYLKKNI